MKQSAVIVAMNGGRVISQQELRDFYELERKFLDLEAQYLATAERHYQRLERGAHQAPGKFALRRPKAIWRRIISYKSKLIQVKGKTFVEDLRARTPKVECGHTRLKFEDPGRNV